MMMRKQLQDRRAGFTLIELLIVVVIIGILAAIALPRLAGTREGAYFSTLQSDLRNLSNAMEVYYNANDFSYEDATAAALGPGAGNMNVWEPSTNVQVVSLTPSASFQGWSAELQHTSISDFANRTCAIFVGDAPALAPATDEGVIACNR